MRQGKVSAIAGYDGVYGKIKVFSEDNHQTPTTAVQQKKLF